MLYQAMPVQHPQRSLSSGDTLVCVPDPGDSSRMVAVPAWQQPSAPPLDAPPIPSQFPCFAASNQPVEEPTPDHASVD